MNRGVTACLLAAVCAASISAGPRADERTARQQRQTLDVYWIDAEGGAATLLVTPAGESVLFDTGHPDDRGAPRIHKVATEAAGLSRIDHLVVTHFHNDHVGGAEALSKLMPIGRVYDNGTASPPPSARDAPLIAGFEKTFAGRRTLLTTGETLALKPLPGTGRLALKLLGTRQTVIAAPAGAPGNEVLCKGLTTEAPDTSDNANSTAWLLELGSFRFFLAGDLTWNTEAKLACPNNLVGQVDVFQVTHHGLDQSNNATHVQSLAPTVSVMSNGTRKGTERRTMATLKALPSIRAMYQVHKNLRDEHNTDDGHIANLEEQCAANFIKMSVAPDGASYTVEIPGQGHKQTYETRKR